jgi:tripartite-type tricarboxylate transporter receptor subunit TctC
MKELVFADGGSMRRRLLTCAIAVCCVLALAPSLVMAAARAQSNYPRKPIHIIVGFGPGGVADIISRAIGQKLSAHFGRNVIIENRPGASGVVAAKIVTGAAPDGYTLLSTTAAVTVSAATPGQASVDPRTQLTPIALMANSPTMFSVIHSAKAKNLMDYVRNTKGGHFTYSTSGVGTVDNLTAEYIFKSEPGIHATHIPYTGGLETINQVLGQHVDMCATTMAAALPFVKDNRLRGLAIASKTRNPLLPGTPTVAENGFPPFASGSWVALFGPRGLPQSIVQTLNAATNEALNEPTVRERLQKLGFEVLPTPQPQFVKFVNDEMEKWGAVIKKIGFRPH